MKAKETQLSGPRFYSNSTAAGVDPIVTTFWPRFSDLIYSVSSSKGDFKRPNAHSYETYSCTWPHGFFLRTLKADRRYWQRWDGCLNDKQVDPYLLPAFPSNVYNNALDKLYEQLRGSLDLSVDLAQTGQTAKLLKDIRKVETYTSSFRSLRSLVRGVASARLGYVYGVKPLLSSIYGTLDSMLDNVGGNLLTCKGRASDRFGLPEVWLSAAGTSWNLYRPAVKIAEHRCEIQCRYITAGSDPAKWTSLNPMSIAWELTPYSFVVDWFLDVGNYIRNYETSLLYNNQFVDGYVTKVSFFDCEFATGAAAWSDATYDYLCDLRGAQSRKRLSRTVLTASPMPELPSFKADLGSGRLLNAAALLAVLLKR